MTRSLSRTSTEDSNILSTRSTKNDTKQITGELSFSELSDVSQLAKKNYPRAPFVTVDHSMRDHIYIIYC